MTYRIIQGDAHDVLRTLPAESVACVVSSPPYNVGITYEGSSDALSWPDYWHRAKDVAHELFRVADSGARLWWNIVPTAADTAGHRESLLHGWSSIFAEAGWRYRDLIAWTSARGAGTAWGSWESPSAPNLRGNWEAILLLHKGDWQRTAPAGQERYRDPGNNWQRLMSNVWAIAPEKHDIHPAPFPVMLPSRCIRLSTWPGETVLDPFMGAGTTALAAERLGRNSIGIELSPDYIRLAEGRLKDDAPMLA